MSDIIELIKSRRTVKEFLSKYISHENLFRIIDAGRHAPSSGNIQNWKFIVINEKEKILQMAEASHQQLEIASAPILVVVVGEPEKAKRYYGLRGERLFTIQNCAAAIENMLLEAHSLGIGSCWIGAFDEDEVRSLCGIPEEIRPQAIIAFGYPKEIPNKPPKYPLETVVYFNNWRSKMRDADKYMNDTAAILARKFGAAKETASDLMDKAKGSLRRENSEKIDGNSTQKER
jgi:nitroreductase